MQSERSNSGVISKILSPTQSQTLALSFGFAAVGETVTRKSAPITISLAQFVLIFFFWPAFRGLFGVEISCIGPKGDRDRISA